MAPVYGPQSMAHASDNAVSHTMATGEGHGTAAVEALKRAATGSAFKSVVVDKVRTLTLTLWPLSGSPLGYSIAPPLDPLLQ